MKPHFRHRHLGCCLLLPFAMCIACTGDGGATDDSASAATSPEGSGPAVSTPSTASGPAGAQDTPRGQDPTSVDTGNSTATPDPSLPADPSPAPSPGVLAGGGGAPSPDQPSSGSGGAAGSAGSMGGPSLSGGGEAGGGGTRSTNDAGGQGGSGAGGGPDQVGESSVTVSDDELLWTGVRYYPGGTGVGNRTSGPQGGPTQILKVTNTGDYATPVNISLQGPNADLYAILSPESLPVSVAPGDTLDVELQLETDNSALGSAPAQDDGSTVVEATLRVAAGDSQTDVRMYGLVLTYVELEPTFGQLLDAFSNYDSELPLSLRNDANPNPASLPGVEAGSDEVAAPAFTRADPSQPVVLAPLARFSPPGLVPFGWYPAQNPSQLEEVGAMAIESDPHTNDKSRMLEPPLSRGATSFEPDGAFGVWMEPEGVGVLYTHDGENFDGQHRVKAWTMRDGAGNVIPNTFLLGGEEASNGDYQDYVFVLINATPM